MYSQRRCLDAKLYCSKSGQSQQGGKLGFGCRPFVLGFTTNLQHAMWKVCWRDATLRFLCTERELLSTWSHVKIPLYGAPASVDVEFCNDSSVQNISNCRYWCQFSVCLGIRQDLAWNVGFLSVLDSVTILREDSSKRNISRFAVGVGLRHDSVVQGAIARDPLIGSTICGRYELHTEYMCNLKPGRGRDAHLVVVLRAVI